MRCAGCWLGVLGWWGVALVFLQVLLSWLGYLYCWCRLLLSWWGLAGSGSAHREHTLCVCLPTGWPDICCRHHLLSPPHLISPASHILQHGRALYLPQLDQQQMLDIRSAWFDANFGPPPGNKRES